MSYNEGRYPKLKLKCTIDPFCMYVGNKFNYTALVRQTRSLCLGYQHAEYATCYNDLRAWSLQEIFKITHFEIESKIIIKDII